MIRGAESSEKRRIAFAALLGIASLYLVNVLHPYGQGASFGARRYVSASPLVAIGIAGVLNAAAARPRQRRASIGALSALVVWNVWLLTCYELLVNLYGVYPTLLETMRFAIGLGPP